MTKRLLQHVKYTTQNGTLREVKANMAALALKPGVRCFDCEEILNRAAS